MIPEKFIWINELGLLPRMIQNGLNYYGVKELPGKTKANPTIMAMADSLGLSRSIFPDDDTPWCAVFMAYIAKIARKPMDFKGYELVRAASWAKWGLPVKSDGAMLGDVLVFLRPGGAHVGLYIAESKDSFFVLGGNQSNMVNITEIKKSRLSAVRRFYAVGAPASVKKYFVDSSGKFYTNEK